MKLKALAVAVALSGVVASASALPTVQLGNVPQIDSNLVRNPCGLASPDTGNPVFGCLNDNHAQLVQLSSDETLVINGGQASLDSSDGTFSRLSISLVGASLSTLILNIDATVNGFVRFTDGSGTTGTFALNADGENFFTLTGITGGFLSFATYIAAVETDIVADVKQIRLGGAVTTPVPEPETYALMLAGLGVVGFMAKRRRKYA